MATTKILIVKPHTAWLNARENNAEKTQTQIKLSKKLHVMTERYERYFEQITDIKRRNKQQSEN